MAVSEAISAIVIPRGRDSTGNGVAHVVFTLNGTADQHPLNPAAPQDGSSVVNTSNIDAIVVIASDSSDNMTVQINGVDDGPQGARGHYVKSGQQIAVKLITGALQWQWLRADQTRADLPNLSNWPATANGVQITINGTPVSGTVRPLFSDANVGQALFDKLVPPTVSLGADTAGQPSGLAVLSDNQMPSSAAVQAAIRSYIANDLAAASSLNVHFVADSDALGQLEQFVTSGRPSRTPPTVASRPSTFNQILRSLSRDREVAERIGLIVEVVVDQSGIPSAGPIVLSIARLGNIASQDLGSVTATLDFLLAATTLQSSTMIAHPYDNVLMGMHVVRASNTPQSWVSNQPDAFRAISSGVRLSDDFHAEHLKRVLAGDRSALSTTDLVRGYAIQVAKCDAQGNATTAERGLCDRLVTYTNVDGSTLLACQPDRGLITLNAQANLQTGEIQSLPTFAAFDGWSAVAPRPGLAMATDGQPDTPQEATGIVRTVQPDGVAAIRFQQSYRVRRVPIGPDLRKLDAVPDDTLTVQYLRTEPVAPPVIAYDIQPPDGRGAPDQDGSSMQVSEGEVLPRPTEGVKDIIFRDYSPPLLSTPSGNGTRYLYKPIASLELILQHGVFDTIPASDGWERPDPTVANTYFDTFNDAIPAVAGTAEPRYLSDPLASRLTLAWTINGVDGSPSGTFHSQFPTFPDCRPKALKVVGAPNDGEFVWEDQGALILAVPPNATMDCQAFFSWSEPADLTIFQAVSDLATAMNGSLSAAQLRMIAGSTSAVINPAMSFSVTHATQFPNQVDPANVVITGTPGSTTRTIALAGTLPGLTADKVEVHASWSLQSGIGGIGLVSEPHQAVISAMQLDATGNVVNLQGQVVAASLTFDFHSMKAFAITLYCVTQSRYARYYDPSFTTSTTSTSRSFIVNATAQPDHPAVLYAVPAMELNPRDNDVSSTERLGNRLRVFFSTLFSSGVDEQIGVRLREGRLFVNPSYPPAGASKQYSIRALSQIPPVASLSDGRDPTFIYMIPDGGKGTPFYVDVEVINTDGSPINAFLPFVSLDVVCYQPHGVLASDVVSTELTQVLPDRSITVVRVVPGTLTVHVNRSLVPIGAVPALSFVVMSYDEQTLAWSGTSNPVTLIDNGEGCRISFDVQNDSKSLTLFISEYESTSSDVAAADRGILDQRSIFEFQVPFFVD